MYITQGLATAALHGVTSPFQAALPSLSTPQTTQSHRELWTPQQLQVHIGRQTEQQFHCLQPIYHTNAFKGHIPPQRLQELDFHKCYSCSKTRKLFLGSTFDLQYIHSTQSSQSLHEQTPHYVFLPVKVFRAYARLPQVVHKHLSFYYIKTW